MFMPVEQGTKHPEASPGHRFTQMFTVVIGYPRNYQIRVIKLIRGSNILNRVSALSFRAIHYQSLIGFYKEWH